MQECLTVADSRELDLERAAAELAALQEGDLSVPEEQTASRRVAQLERKHRDATQLAEETRQQIDQVDC